MALENTLRLGWTDPQGKAHTWAEGLHLSFAVSRQLGAVPGKLLLHVNRPPMEVEAGLLSARGLTLLTSGGELLFSADYLNPWVEKQGNTRAVCIAAMDGDGLMRQGVSVSLKAGATLQGALNAMLGQAAPKLEGDRALPRGQVYHGRLMDALADLAASTDAALAIQDGRVRFVYKARTTAVPIPEAELLGEATPMGMGILFQTHPRAFELGGMVSIAGAVYRVITIDMAGDTKSGPWRAVVKGISDERMSAVNAALWT